MRTIFLLTIFSVLFHAGASCQTDQKGFPDLTGPYLGRTPPEKTSEIFAPGVISTGLDESSIAFTPDGKECFWTIKFSSLETIVTSRLENGKWTEPEVAPFAGRYFDGWPAIRPDGERMFFHSSRPANDAASGITAQFNIWYVDKTATGWTEPALVNAPVNGSENTTCPSVTKEGTLYVSRRFKDMTEMICRAKLIDGKYGEPEILPAAINTGEYNFHAFVAPDESYLVMPAFGRDDAIGGGWNYYVSFNKGQNDWSELINLGGKVNSAFCLGTPSLSCDGKYFFFQVVEPETVTPALERKHSLKELIERQIRFPAANCSDLYWIDTTIIEEIRSNIGK